MKNLYGRVAQSVIIQQLLRRYANLMPREQKMFVAAAFFLTVFFVFKLVLQPTHQLSLSAKQHYLAKQSELTWMKENEERVLRLSKKIQSKSDKASLLSVISNAAKRQSLTLKRLLPDKDGQGISVWLDSVKFTTYLSWLDELTTKNKIVVETLSIYSADEEGFVDVSMKVYR